MKVHLIAIGGSAMHNMALSLHQKGFEVTGSDDIIFDPSKSRLKEAGLLPKEMGWFPKKITKDIDVIILGMHARIDNPELKKSQEIGLPIYSYPEYIYEHSKNKKRVVIGGSHGKTTITAMIIHVLHYYQIDCDYMVGAQLDGFSTMVKLTDESSIIILEGDEYLSSPIDRKPKFHWYKPQVAVLSGISWDHINVFPTFDNYKDQFRIFINDISDCLIYCEDDENLLKLAKEASLSRLRPYKSHAHRIENGVTYLQGSHEEVPLSIFGDHNLKNLNAARFVCEELDISEVMFLEAIQSFKGASNRLELVRQAENSAIYKDFAHSPSKLKAASYAMKKQFSDRKLIACMELHTFSSLNQEFLKQYANSMDDPDIAIVYFNLEAIAHKKLTPITEIQVYNAFSREDLMIFTNSVKLQHYLESLNWGGQNLLMMSSGNFDGLNFEDIM